MADVDAGNAQEAQESANVTKDEALQSIRSNGQAMAQVLRGLSDEQLDRGGSLFGMPMTTEQFIQNIVISHPREHLQSIKQGMAG
jgi:hypothetical protein